MNAEVFASVSTATTYHAYRDGGYASVALRRASSGATASEEPQDGGAQGGPRDHLAHNPWLAEMANECPGEPRGYQNDDYLYEEERQIERRCGCGVTRRGGGG